MQSTGGILERPLAAARNAGWSKQSWRVRCPGGKGVKVGGRQGRAPANRKRLQSGTRSQHGGDLPGLSSDRGPESHEDAAGGREAVWIDGDTRDQSFSLLPPRSIRTLH